MVDFKNMTTDEKLESLNSRFDSLSSDMKELCMTVGVFADKAFNHFEIMEANGTLTEEWSKEFHRLLMNEFSKIDKNIVYGLNYINAKTRERRLVLAAADTFEKAKELGESMLMIEKETVGDWMLEGFQSLKIPKNTEKALKKVDNETFDKSKPHWVFINDLKYVQDSFCKNMKEKNMIGRIIKNIEKQVSKK